MGKITFLSHILETKGVVHSFERSAQILMRYSFGKKRFADMMSFLDRHFGASGVRVTFCITASLLHDHSIFIKSFRKLGHDFAAHGYIHTNMKNKSKEEQVEIIEKSFRLFERYNIPVHGFRCPYLSYNSNTIEALASSSFLWTSNNMVFWDSFSKTRKAENNIRKLGALYRFHDASATVSVPAYIGRLLEIPITAPDDELVFERCRVKSPKQITDIWLRILSRIHKRGELFHLLFHPERFQYVKDSIKEVLDEAKRLGPPVWIASLYEITKWMEEKKRFKWKCEKINSKTKKILITAPQRATVLVKTAGHERNLFYKGYDVISPAPGKKGVFHITTDKAQGHIIRLSERCPREVEEFLAGEGFLIEKTSAGFQKDSMYIDWHGAFEEKDKLGLLDAIDGSGFPLLRLWRWPDGARSALTLSSDVDSINVADFFKRLLYF